MKLAQQIASFEAKAVEIKDGRKHLLEMASADGEGRTFTDEEDSEYEDLGTELKAVEKHLARLREQESEEVSSAAPVASKSQAQKPVRSSPMIHVRNSDPEDTFQGQSFTRRVIARTLAHLSQGEYRPSDIAEMRWGKTHPQLVQMIKAGVAGGAHGSGEWGTELAQADARYTGDFIDFLYAQTVYNQLPLREVPDNVTIKGQDGGSTAFWVGQSTGIPVTTADFSTVTLTNLKVAAIAVISKELMRRSSPSAEQLVRDSLVAATAQRIDTTFLSADNAVTGESPAGLLQGLSSLGSNGYDADAVRADILELYAPFIAAKNASGLYFVMSRSTAKAVSLMRNAFGQAEFPGLTANGGTLEGDPVVTGDNVGADDVILLKPSDIYKIGASGIEVSVSMDATIEQDSAPTGETNATPVAASATLNSMFQTESVALKVVHPMNYAKRRSSAVAFIGDAGWGNTASTTA